ncbi:hypothetical protein K491DRAFT_700118 [Lophiostoma macrostomum CBS 122681]|uniref:Uncharacterized protein n=1 Tax=Lophiostoma macrostomum CBS 122681 TaxID=1314788 RepID=A0A6A6TWH3_9PLEO|nr:hypothetical protein K491DRAFT_700118 [Lophiostoma macrostomum CBS 122681]
MNEHLVITLQSTVDLIASTLDTNPSAWRDHLQPIRDITASLEFLDTAPDDSRKQWQLPLIRVFQRVSFTDADNGGVPDIADWCLRQSLTLLQLYPEDFGLLTLIGRNWLSRAQKSLAKIHQAERDSSSSGGSLGQPLSRSEEQQMAARAAVEAEDRLHTADYVEARGILLPATEYLKRSVDGATVQSQLTGGLLATVSHIHPASRTDLTNNAGC